MKLPLQTVDAARPGEAPPLLIAHGLFGSARNWATLARRIAAGEGCAPRTVHAADMRNHGEGPTAPGQTYADMAGDLSDTMRALGAEVDLLGHSMGGKAAMLAALTRPEGLRRLVIADIAPVAYAHDHADTIRAMLSVDLSGIARRGDMERALAPLIDDRGLRAFLLTSLVTGSDGARWRLNLPVLLDDMPAIIGWPDAAGAWAGETLFLRGGASDYAADDRLAPARALFPAMTVATVAGAGHWLHAEAPDAFLAALGRFLG